MDHSCCTPGSAGDIGANDGQCAPARLGGSPGERRSGGAPAADAPREAKGGSTAGMRRLAGGAFLMGTDDGEGFPDDGEGPVREVSVPSFHIDATQVTNREFAAFVDATGYVTESEQFGFSFVFHLHVPRAAHKKGLVRDVPGLGWWRGVDRACWKRPEGPGTDLKGRLDHPVVHVTWNDAVGYCRWAGKRLPSEAEWEYSARGGLVQKRYPWGDELTPSGRHLCNIWQGRFPEENTEEDGYGATCPVRAFPANGYGLYGVAGNVWEWCGDWFSAAYPASGERSAPRGPASGTSRVMRGGSFLCHKSYCNRYRVAARTSNTPESASSNLGFRCVRDV
jgi:formylglycine-generating enzyme